MSKIGLVVEGGGMKCAYSAGILDSFLDHGIKFDYYIGVSAGAANLASFLAGQRDRNRRFYVNHIQDPMYFGLKPFLKTGDLFNLRYIYGEITNEGGKDPLDFDAFWNASGEYEAVSCDAVTGKAVYFPKRVMRRNDYRHIMASCAMPAACKPIKIGGRPCYDGGVIDAIPTRRAMKKGCDKLVVLLSKPRDFVKRREKFHLLYTIMCCKYPKIRHALDKRHIMYKKCQDHMFSLEKEGRALLFAPETDVKISTYTTNPKINQKLYDLGIADAERRLDELEKFMV